MTNARIPAVTYSPLPRRQSIHPPWLLSCVPVWVSLLCLRCCHPGGSPQEGSLVHSIFSTTCHGCQSYRSAHRRVPAATLLSWFLLYLCSRGSHQLHTYPARGHGKIPGLDAFPESKHCSTRHNLKIETLVGKQNAVS